MLKCRALDTTNYQAVVQRTLPFASAPSEHVHSIAVSCDEALLAVATDAAIALYAMHSVVEQDSSPITAWTLPHGDPLKQVGGLLVLPIAAGGSTSFKGHACNLHDIPVRLVVPNGTVGTYAVPHIRYGN